EHDVHDYDSADHQRNRDHAQSDRRYQPEDRLNEIIDRVRGDDAESILVVVSQPVARAHQHFRLILHVFEFDVVAPPDGDRQALAGPEEFLEGRERNNDEIVSRLAEERSLLFRDANDLERQAVNLHLAPDGFARAEEFVGDLRTDHNHVAAGFTLALLLL